MPLDGNDNGLVALPLITPHAYHPEAPASAVALARSMHAAYAYARSGGRLIGNQTYRTTHLTSIANNHAVESASLVAIAEFRVVLPSWANHVVAAAWYSLLDVGQQVSIEHQVTVYDGTNTDSGAVITQNVEAETSGAVNVNGYTSFDYSRGTVATAHVELVDTLAFAGSVVVTVLARAYRAIDGAVSPYVPHLITAAYEVIG